MFYLHFLRLSLPVAEALSSFVHYYLSMDNFYSRPRDKSEVDSRNRNRQFPLFSLLSRKDCDIPT